MADTSDAGGVAPLAPVACIPVAPKKDETGPTEMEVDATDAAKTSSPEKKRSADEISPSAKEEDPVTPSTKRAKMDEPTFADEDWGEEYVPPKGQFCDVCFLPKDIGLTNLGKCADCGLVVHSSCYEKKYLDETGHFKCDACLALKRGKMYQCKPATPKKGKKPRKEPDVVSSPAPLPDSVEAVSDGRVYPKSDSPEVDVFCQLCMRRDVIGGMKPTDEGKWVHLACTMSTTDTFFDGSVVRGVTFALKKNLKERKKKMKEGDEEPKCEACGVSEGFLVQCTHIEPKRKPKSPPPKSPKKIP
mmetsp:Transcript_68544/g.101844  ORF Transcript_68544/g.101844 Transcript_68544/m.101844 type:complete len:302 (+) Transcript_68544:121-1026(+)